MNFTGLIGIVVILLLAWAFSKDHKVVNWRVVGWGLGIQLLIALFIFVLPAGSKVFMFINKMVLAVLSSASAGTEFVFGNLAKGPGTEGSLGYFFAFQAMPSIVFFAALVGLLYHLGIMQWLIKGFAWIFTKLMRISGAESLSASSNIFVGVESSLIIKPHINTMTKSELNTVLTVGMATVASSMLAVYIMVLQHQFPTIAGHLVSASLMNAPAAIVISKLLYPERETPETLGLKIKPEYDKKNTVFETILDSANSGVKLIVGIVAMLLAFLGLVALLDKIMVLIGSPVNGLFGANIDFSLKGLLGYVFYPITWCIGIPGPDVAEVSRIIGERVILSEVTAFQDLAVVIEQGLISPRSAVITTYALTGFAHIASVAIFVGGYAALAPKRAGDLSKLGFRALLGATLATLLSASIAGIFLSECINTSNVEREIMTGDIILAMLSGLAFAIIGIMMRLGQSKNVVPLHIAMCMGIVGAIYFGVQINWAEWNVPLYVILMALGGTVGLITNMIFTKMALARGPLSPLWTATNLTFIVVTIYAALMFSEKITLMPGLALIFGVVCVIFAANLGDSPKNVEGEKKPIRIKIEYALLLFLVLLGNSFSFLVIKDLATRLIRDTSIPYIAVYKNHMYFLMYGSMAIASFVIVKFIDKTKPISYKWVWLYGLIAASGSVLGMVLLSSVAGKLPASIVFTLNSIVCILAGCIVSVTFFKEKLKPAWWFTIGFGIVAVVLANIIL